MSDSKIEIKPIAFSIKNVTGASSNDNTNDLLQAQLSALTSTMRERLANNVTGANNREIDTLLAVAEDFVKLMTAMDHQYGADGAVPMTDTHESVDDTLHALAELESWLSRLSLVAERPRLFNLQLGIAYWAMRHGIHFSVVAPVVNALAEQSNAAQTRQETAAIFAMMQGLVQHLAPGLQADLERSNPERPWRLLILNFAITAIRSGDAAMMRHAFDALNTFLPDERAGFYQEAYALASQPGFPADTRVLIEAEHTRWTRTH
jgi:hypothetical protein